MSMTENNMMLQVTERETDLAEIKDLLNVLLSELRALRRDKLPGDPEKIEALLAALYKIYTDAEFTAAWILETCLENDPDATRLLQSIKAAMTGAVPGSKKLSRFLGKVTGIFCGYRLDISNPHTRDGATFKISVTK